jgi:hypothetical protein
MVKKTGESKFPWYIYIFTMIILTINQINWFGKGISPLSSDTTFSVLFHILFIFCSILIVFIGIIALLTLRESA